MWHKTRQRLIRGVSGTRLEPLARKMYGHLIPSKGNKYDQQTFQLMRQFLKPNSNCIDIGAYRGEILSEMVKYAPRGNHFAFEPIPENFDFLVKKFGSKKVKVFNLALSDKKGTAVFHHVLGRAARSGFKKFEYPDKNQVVEKINVKMDKLDAAVPADTPIHLIKIDVEGAELDVLRGAKKLLKRDKPIVIFEHDEKAKEFNTSPAQIYELLVDESGLDIYLMKDFLQNKPALGKANFEKLVLSGSESYFMASPKAS